MVRRICTVQIQPRKCVLFYLDHAEFTAAFTLQHELLVYTYVDPTDQEHVCPDLDHALEIVDLQMICPICDRSCVYLVGLWPSLEKRV